MTKTLRHRGPDDGGHFVDESAGVALGNRRLAVIDLSIEGHQPMVSPSGRYVMTFNGEIYNFEVLRRELRGAGHPFRGGSDTEVLLAAIEQWGIGQTLSRANGMFALAVWDRRDRTLSLARDRFGEKPLYYGWTGSGFLFGSELKALRAHPSFASEIDRNSLTLYFRHNCIPAPYTIYSGIQKLMPGTTLTIGQSTPVGTVPEPTSFWTLRSQVEEGLQTRTHVPLEAVIEEAESVLADAVAIRMHADVPVGILLSGGIDSSLVAAFAQERHQSKVRTFTIAFDDPSYDEAGAARAVAVQLGTEHTERLVTAADALAIVPVIPELYDEPFADSSQIPTAILARLTREDVTVALAGDGGDELFGGYNRYAWAEHFWRRLKPVPLPLRRLAGSALGAVPPGWWDRAFDRSARLLPSTLRTRLPGTKLQKVARVLPAANLDDAYLALTSHFERPSDLVLSSSEPSTLLQAREKWPALDPVNLMLYLDTMTYLPDDILTKVDRATMGVSLEARLPFLDPRVSALAWRLPLELKVRGGTGKWLLRELLRRRVAAEIVERPKAGFGIPLGPWLRGPLRSWAEELLDPARLRAEGFLDVGRVQGLWRSHLSRRRDHQFELWDVLMFEAWLVSNQRLL